MSPMAETHQKNQAKPPNRRWRIGLQFKSVLILAGLIIAVTGAGGWLYFQSVSRSLVDNDFRHASWTGQALSLAAQQDLLLGRTSGLQALCTDCIRNSNILHVSLSDAQGREIASASRGDGSGRWRRLTSTPAVLTRIWQEDESTLVLATPIILRKAEHREASIVSLRLVLDTSLTRQNLLGVQQRITGIAALIVVLALPLGYLLVWRVLLGPIRHLAAISRKLGEGDLACRTGLHRADEIGELSAAFDAMVEEIARSREALVVANDRLEKKAARRTEDLERANTRLREEIAEREDFTRAVSHDLNAPLRNISGMLTMIMRKYRGVLPEEVVSRLDRIAANTADEASRLGDLLELSRIRSCPEKRQIVEMGPLLRSVCEAFGVELRGRGMEWIVHEPMPVLYVEKARIRQAFWNLVDNAVKYMNRRRGGRIEIGYRKVDDFHEFFVQDNGPGIAPSEHQRIFYVFRRAQDPAVAKVEGRGVGLAAVKSIVSNYDGKAWVQSEPGQGATFFVALGTRCTRPPEEAATASAAEAQFLVAVKGL